MSRSVKRTAEVLPLPREAIYDDAKRRGNTYTESQIAFSWLHWLEKCRGVQLKTDKIGGPDKENSGLAAQFGLK